MKRVIFQHKKSWNEVVEEVAEYDYEVSEEEIQKDFEDWVWNIVGDKFTWYKKE